VHEDIGSRDMLYAETESCHHLLAADVERSRSDDEDEAMTEGEKASAETARSAMRANLSMSDICKGQLANYISE
jgi:hypothetical protein